MQRQPASTCANREFRQQHSGMNAPANTVSCSLGVDSSVFQSECLQQAATLQQQQCCPCKATSLANSKRHDLPLQERTQLPTSCVETPHTKQLYPSTA
jgi:hypothetical protein